MKPSVHLIGLLTMLVACPQPGLSYGFDDSGLVGAGVKTSYYSLSEGTSSNPLTITNPCLWPSGAVNGCPSGPSSYSQSNAWWSGIYAFQTSDYWVLDMNNETPAFDSRNPGPPHASLDSGGRHDWYTNTDDRQSDVDGGRDGCSTSATAASAASGRNRTQRPGHPEKADRQLHGEAGLPRFAVKRRFIRKWQNAPLQPGHRGAQLGRGAARGGPGRLIDPGRCG